MRLNSHGEVFLKHANATIAALRGALESVAQNGALEPTIRIGALASAAARILPIALEAFQKEVPRSHLKVITSENAVLLEQLRVGRLDFVVGRLAPPETIIGLSFEHLFSENMVIVVRPGHPLLGIEKGQLFQLSDYLVLMPSQHSSNRAALDTYLIANGVSDFPHSIEIAAESFGREMVLSGDAVWFISHGVVARDLAEGALKSLPIDLGDTKGSVGLTIRAGSVFTPSVSHLIDIIRNSNRNQCRTGRGKKLASVNT